MTDNNGESDTRQANGRPRPILPAGIGHRIRQCSGRVGSHKKLADAAGFSEGQLYRYMREENEPSVSAAAQIAQAAGVSLDWLVLGEGSGDGHAAGIEERGGRYEVTHIKPALDVDLLESIVRVLSQELDLAGIILPPEKWARAVRLLYQLYEGKEVQPDRGAISDLLSLAS